MAKLYAPPTFTDLRELDPTLVEDLTSVADDVRDIAVELGGCLYQVGLVWTRWSGGRRGAGTEQVIDELLLLPTPQVEAIGSIREELNPVGLIEAGSLSVTGLSPRYTEDFLSGKCRSDRGNAKPLSGDVNFYWEIWLIGGGKVAGERRRFVMANAPERRPTEFDWRVTLMRAQRDRSRDGRPR